MDVQEILVQIDHAITEIDLELHEWQEGLDMMSFIYVDASFELWTNDDPPRLVTPAVLAQAAGKELRVMNYVNGERVQVGTAVMDKDGVIKAKIDTDKVPELKMPSLKGVSISKDMLEDDPGLIGWRDIYKTQRPKPQAMAHFHMREDGSVFDNYAGEEIVPPLETRKREWNALEIVNDAINKVEHRRADLHEAARRMSMEDFRKFHIEQKIKEEAGWESGELENHPFFDKEN